eukprot:366052-Chlamydomonas_euryale.AAC.23
MPIPGREGGGRPGLAALSHRMPLPQALTCPPPSARMPTPAGTLSAMKLPAVLLLPAPFTKHPLLCCRPCRDNGFLYATAGGTFALLAVFYFLATSR